jgi:hypothetical protein
MKKFESNRNEKQIDKNKQKNEEKISIGIKVNEKSK